MLAINPGAAGEVVLATKPAITTDSDRMDRGALDQLLLHTGTLGSIYHKNPEVCVSEIYNPNKVLSFARLSFETLLARHWLIAQPLMLTPELFSFPLLQSSFHRPS